MSFNQREPNIFVLFGDDEFIYLGWSSESKHQDIIFTQPLSAEHFAWGRN